MKWEYLFVQMDGSYVTTINRQELTKYDESWKLINQSELPLIDVFLTEMGDQGWELVAVVTDPSLKLPMHREVFFKRPKE